MLDARLGALAMGAQVLCTLWVGGAAQAEVLRFHARLTPVAGSPPSASHAGGQADLTLDTDSKWLSWRITFSGLSGRVTGGRFHTPPEPGPGLGPGLEFPGPPPRAPAAAIVAARWLNDIQIGDLRAGLWSVSLATPGRPGGEIAGDIESAP